MAQWLSAWNLESKATLAISPLQDFVPVTGRRHLSGCREDKMRQRVGQCLMSSIRSLEAEQGWGWRKTEEA